MLFCYVAWALGYEGFVIVGHIDMPLPMISVICGLLFALHVALATGFVMDWYNWKVLYFAIPLTAIHVIGNLLQLFPPLISSTLLPFIVFLVAALKKHRFRKRALRPLIVMGVTLIHQMLVALFYGIDLSAPISIYQFFRVSISEGLLILLLFTIGGAIYNEHSLSWELLVFPGRVRDDRHRHDSSQGHSQNPSNIPINRFEQWVMRSVMIVVQIIQWMFILWVCNLDNLFLDALVITTSFICHGLIIAKRKHFKPIILCTLAATAMFYVAARFTISFQYSHFFPIIIGLLLVYTVYRISYQFEKAEQERLEKDLARLAKLEIQLADAWKQIDKLS